MDGAESCRVLRTRLWIVLTVLGMLAASFFGGVAVGFSQWIALRKLLSGAWRWILVVGFAWWLGVKLAYEVLTDIFYPTSNFLGFPQYGPDPVADFIIGGGRGLVLGLCTGTPSTVFAAAQWH